MFTGRRKSRVPRQGESYLLEIEGIPVEVVRKQVKNLNLRVCPPAGEVRISVPHTTDEQAIRSFVAAKLDWIHRSRNKIAQRPQTPRLQMVTGERHNVLGESYPLVVIDHAGDNRVCLENRALCLYVCERSDLTDRTRVLDSWYRQQLMAHIGKLLQKWEPRLGVRVARFGVRKMKTRWGSCNVVARRIWLNLELAKRPLAILEYVLVHELMHLHERRHNARFYGLMDQFLPDWRVRRGEIDRALHV
ncbi:MAG: SprT family zinc-dependent metalloprotease [Desulfuromonadales bacterium]|nr:SprT family zinc-dependent metalloprotease [Desulfuromonadales bacterium]